MIVIQLCSDTYCRKASFILVCQPLPPLLKNSITSSSIRSVVDCLGDFDFGRPARRAAVPRFALANIASDHSGLSLSVISGSVELLIASHLAFFGFAQADYTNKVRA